MFLSRELFLPLSELSVRVTGYAHGELGGVEVVHELITLHAFFLCYKCQLLDVLLIITCPRKTLGHYMRPHNLSGHLRLICNQNIPNLCIRLNCCSRWSALHLGQLLLRTGEIVLLEEGKNSLHGGAQHHVGGVSRGSVHWLRFNSSWFRLYSLW